TAKSAGPIGKPVDRVDGRLKVTGGARYAAEAQVENVTHGVLVTSTIAKGKIRNIDTSAAEKAPGVLAVITHRNAPRVFLPDKELADAEVRIEQTYTIPAEHHNPMEPHATLAVWEGEKLTLYDKTQWVDNVQNQVAAAFEIPTEDVRVLSPFVGGAFGSALRAWTHVFIAALAAKHV